ncbi:GNAT family N-acetyltransferase [Enterovibrio sp. ZSDZ42]|uniref:GNAT family N-acetyltransferase n=1 Tax=Enterovibrio gelatinilyticus TaxID=2899819 RepID=A0ABT5R717_9GAMM|nr:GNAT family N-acetyltransferase [Enterovibrio sp. ZSDZ42]MDD1796067.1 GNAT family N-acetyltransferase [Enterovibrio sp. ZSDZ42]
MNTFKRGQAIPLIDGYTIALIQRSDLDDIIEMLGEPKVTEYLYFAPAPEDVYRGYFGPIIESTVEAIGHGEWPESPTSVIRDSEGRFMGMVGLHAVMFLKGNYELGFQFTEKAWGKGLASSGSEFLLSIAFDVFGAHKVTADCYRSNVGSYKTLLKVGLVEEGCQAAYYKTQTGFDDRLHYGMTKAQYSALSR